MSTMKAFYVFLNGEEVDKVFYTKGHSGEDVKRSLINHDGYNSNIRVISEEYYDSLDEYQKIILLGT